MDKKMKNGWRITRNGKGVLHGEFHEVIEELLCGLPVCSMKTALSISDVKDFLWLHPEETREAWEILQKDNSYNVETVELLCSDDCRLCDMNL